MQTLMNINSDNLIMRTSLDDVQVGELVHTKGRTILDWGFTWEVAKVTNKQVHCVLKELWFPVRENTPFGRIAKGENSKDLEWLREHESMSVGKLTCKLWKDGRRVGFTEDGVVTLMPFV